MGKYDAWRPFFADLEPGEHRVPLEVLSELVVGGLPPAAFNHQAWWSNRAYSATSWTDYGWYARPRLREEVVLFTRTQPSRGRPAGLTVPESPKRVADAPVEMPAKPTGERLVLLGCVAQKRADPAPARDLYISDLWRKRRGYAESTGQPWMILSAEHGLIDPGQRLAPYDRYLESQDRSYREQWSRTTANAILRRCRELGLSSVEIHAGSAYIDYGLGETLESSRIELMRPLKGLRMGEQLSWYGQVLGTTIFVRAGPRSAVGSEMPAPVEITAEHARYVAEVYASGVLGESWDELPEVWHRHQTDPCTQRLWITFVACVDRARDAARLWAAAHQAFEEDPWIFQPAAVVDRSLVDLAEALRRHGVSQRHSVDAQAWRLIAESLAGESCPEPIRRAIDGLPVMAQDVLSGLMATWPHGTAMFPLLSGPKIGPMWTRMLVWPGGAPIEGVDVIPVAVDTHVQRVTEMLGLVPVHELDERHRSRIQRTWFDAVEQSGGFGAPGSLDGTAAGIDPALWALGKEGCSRCEQARVKQPIGSICELCVLGRVG